MTAPVVFISYSHRDEKWHDRVLDHLKALTIDRRVDAWSDERIRTGTNWRTEIQSALTSASAAILIVTRHFLSSSFIQQEEISALLRRRSEDGLQIYAVIAEPCLWNKFRWLESMQVVIIADRDKKQPSRYAVDQHLVRLISDIDDTLARQTQTAATVGAMAQATARGQGAKPRVSTDERRRQIDQLLEQFPDDSIDGLPNGLLSLITDVSQIAVLEEKLDPKTPPVVMTNAINAIGMLADSSWDDREIKSPNSLGKLTTLYEQLDDVGVRLAILRAITKFSAPEIPFGFLFDRLAVDPPIIKGAILADLQFYVDRPYLAQLVNQQLLPLLHEFCSYPQAKCIYSDEFHEEMDFRFWVFRCLGAIGDARSAEIIEDFIAEHSWPLAALAEAANAHWDITRTPVYVDVLRKAREEGVAGNTEHALREIEEHLGIASPAARKRTRKAQTGRTNSGRSN